MIPLLVVAAVAWAVVLLTAPWLPPPLTAVVYELGAYICHQRPDRSFHIATSQLPVCARCIGVYCGAAIGGLAIPAFRRLVRSRLAIAAAVVPGLVSWLLEWTGLAHPDNATRAATGAVAGFVIAAVLLATLHYEQCVPRRPIAPSPPPTPI